MKVLRNLVGLLPGRQSDALQVAALCRNSAGKVLLITSRGTGRWVIPKGWPMAGRSLAGAAAQEAWEEAGIRGTIGEDEIGRFTYQKTDTGIALPIEVCVFLLEVTEQSDAFPEAGQRRRAWFDPAEASAMVAEPGLRHILTELSRTAPA